MIHCHCSFPKPKYNMRKSNSKPWRWTVYAWVGDQYRPILDKVSESEARKYIKKLYVLDGLDVPMHLRPWYYRLVANSWNLFMEFWR